MLIKVKKNWKDYAEFCKGKKLSRREMMLKSLTSGAIGVLLPDFVAQNLAHAAPTCPAPARVPGAIGQIFSEGGATMGARFISEAQAAVMNAAMAANYGISGQANLRRLGPNMVIDTTSPFGFTILQGPPGYPGGAAAWQANVLSKVSGGAHLGPFNADDGAGVDTGLLGGVSPFKVSTMGKDLRVNARNAPASWANGLPAAGVSANVTPAAFASTFSLTPAANGLINSAALTASSEAANALSDALGSIFNTSARKGSSNLMQAAGCGFFGNSALADPNYGNTLFNPTNIAALTAKTTVAQLTTKEQALLAAYYQSAMGVAGGVIVEFNGRDYHGNNVQTDIAPKDIEEARAIVMFLAACDAAQAKGAMIYVSNGQAIADGVQAVTATINGTAANLNGPVASGDAGGAYNAGLVIFYDPAGAPPAAKFTGTVTAASGNAKIDPNVGSSKEAMAGLYISALSWIGGGTVPASAMTAIKGAGLKGTATLI